MLYIVTVLCVYGLSFGISLFYLAVLYHVWLQKVQPTVFPDRTSPLTSDQRKRLYESLNELVRLGFILIIVIGAINIYVSGLAATRGPLPFDVAMILATIEAVRRIRKQVVAVRS